MSRMYNVYCTILGHIPSEKTNTARIIMTDTYYKVCKCKRCGCFLRKDQYGVWVKDTNIYPEEKGE